MEYVPAFEFLGLFNFLKANNASIILAKEVSPTHIRQSLKLINQLPRLQEELDGLAETDEGVDDLAQEVEGELLAGDDVGEELDVQQQHDEVEHEGYYVEYKALLCPLFTIVELN